MKQSNRAGILLAILAAALYAISPPFLKRIPLQPPRRKLHEIHRSHP
jgi:hypothetical protein